MGVGGRVGGRVLGLDIVGNDVKEWIGVCRMMESSGPSTIVDGEDGVLGFSSTDSNACWRNCNGDKSKLVASVGEGGLDGRGEG